VFARQRTVDPFGHWLHALLGAIGCFLICSPVSIIEFAWVPVALCFLVRFPRHFGTHGPLRRSPVAWCTLAWIAWQGLSTRWSLDRTLGVEEWGAVRFGVFVLLLWPVLDRRPWLIGGLALGMLAANLAQVSHALGVALDIPAMTFDRLPNRNSGWWQPVVGGTMLTAAVGLHLPAALTGKGRSRVFGILGTVSSVIGVAATGSRGAWLATGALLVFGVLWILRRSVGRGLRWGHAPLIAAVLVVLGAAGYRTLWPGMRERAIEGVDEVRRVAQSNDYSTYTGARILMAEWGAKAFAAHPVRGIGAGSFRPWVSEQMTAEGKDPARNPAHAHCHNTFLQVAATTGIIGLLLFGSVVVLSVRGGFAPAAGDPGHELSGYAASPGFALVGMLLVTPVDVINVNAQTAGLFWILVALNVWGRPSSARADAMPAHPLPDGGTGQGTGE
jgi:O-antigen ligase